MVGLALTAALLHATWSAVAKTTTDRLAGFFVMSAVSAGLGAAGLGICGATIPRATCWFVAASALLHVAYMLLMAWSYRIGDFSQVYPMARGTSPLLVTTIGLVGLGGRPSLPGLCGVVLISSGLWALARAGPLNGRANRGAVVAALSTGVAITTYTVVDGLGVRQSGSVLTYLLWLQLLMGVGFIVVVAALRGRTVLTVDRSTCRRGVCGGLIAALAYSLVLVAQTRASLGTVSALREVSIVFGALIGALVLNEPLGRRRISASALVLVGVLLIA
ncbi:MAG TPA: DMT family transporter [Marmoricola sp.]|nr:DMT family transporter [Marmoricola sp.]